jgi:hypothetical protein
MAKGLWRGCGMSIIEADFTKLQPPQATGDLSNLLITNPPYVRHHYIPSSHKQELAQLVESRLKLRTSGLAGLYVYIMLLAHDWLSEDAISAWLVPSEFMDVIYGKTLREYLARKVTLKRIHRFETVDVQFEDALVSSAVVIFQKHEPSPRDRTEITFGGSLETPLTTVKIANRELRELTKWSHVSLRKGLVAIHDETRLSDLFKIKRGIATGDNSFFILPLESAFAKKIPREFLKPILPGPKDIPTNVIEEDQDHFPALPKKFVVIDCKLPESSIKSRYPDFWKYLEVGLRNGVNNRYLPSKRLPWYSQEERDVPPFLCSYLGRNRRNGKPFRFILNKSKAIATNVFLLLYPIGELRKALGEGKTGPAEVLKTLEGIETDSIISAGRSYGGGLHKLEPSELGSVPANLLLDALGIQKTTITAF